MLFFKWVQKCHYDLQPPNQRIGNIDVVRSILKKGRDKTRKVCDYLIAQ